MMNDSNEKPKQGVVLFLCTGNYYRSRFAEIYFNHCCLRHGCGWRAESRGLRPSNPGNVGPISLKAKARLESLGVGVDISRWPIHLTPEDIEASDLVIALQELEHRPMVAECFPDFEERIRYWDVPDVGFMAPDKAMAMIESHVLKLVKCLSNGDAPDVLR